MCNSFCGMIVVVTFEKIATYLSLFASGLVQDLEAATVGSFTCFGSEYVDVKFDYELSLYLSFLSLIYPILYITNLQGFSL